MEYPNYLYDHVLPHEEAERGGLMFGNCWSFCSFSLFVFATWGLWWWFLDPAVDLLSATVDLHVVVSDVYHRTFICIETDLPLVGPLNKFIDIYSCSSIMSSGFLALWQSLVSSANLDILLTILLSRSFIYIINSSRPNTLPCGTPDVTGAQLL